MAANSKIEWTEQTWNPLAGCSIVSPGCHNCYAALMAKRLAAMGQAKYQGLTNENGWTGKLNFSETDLKAPLKWKKPRRVFVNSMSDLFHEDAPDEWIDRVWAVMAFAGQHTYQVLTKRAQRMFAYLNQNRSARVKAAALSMGFALEFQGISLLPKILPNVWLGVSVEDQNRTERIPWLLKTPAAIRFLSVEPLLGPVRLSGVYHDYLTGVDVEEDCHPMCDGSHERCPVPHQFATAQIDWVIVGGESGPGSRECRPDWVRGLVADCKRANVSCFVKQLGANVVTRNDMVEDDFNSLKTGWPDPDVEHHIHGFQENYQGADCRIRLRDKKGGDPGEWPPDLRVREFLSQAVRS